MSKVTRRQYRSGSVFQRKDGMWIGRLEAGTDREGHRRQITVSATSEPACKERLEEKRRELARTGVPDKVSARRMTVERWAEQYLALAVTELRPGAYGSSASSIKKWIVPTIGRKRLDALTPADIRSVFDAQRKAGRSEGTRARTHSVLMQMLKTAMLEGYDVPDRLLLVKKPQPGENDREAIKVAEALAILNVVSTRPDASLWAALLLQGVRQAERLGLTWACVDFENDTMDISWQLQALPYIDNKEKALGFRVPDAYKVRHLEGQMHLVRPKTRRSTRVIPMVPWMRASLLAWRDLAPESDHDLVWPDPDGKPVKSADDRAEWRRIQDLADVRHPAGRYYVLHEARHTTATLLRQLGVPVEVIEAILGHSKFVTSYDHSDQLPKSREALEQLAERLALI